MDNDGRMLLKKQFVLSNCFIIYSSIESSLFVFRLNNRRQSRLSTATRPSIQQIRSIGATN